MFLLQGFTAYYKNAQHLYTIQDDTSGIRLHPKNRRTQQQAGQTVDYLTMRCRHKAKLKIKDKDKRYV